MCFDKLEKNQIAIGTYDDKHHKGWTCGKGFKPQ